jgi:hypothetical protein
MTYRHHFAEKIGEGASWHIYRFTPDSILMKDWGVVRMDESNFEIIELAPDTSGWGWTEDNQKACCSVIFAKFLRTKKVEGKVPEKLEFVA